MAWINQLIIGCLHLFTTRVVVLRQELRDKRLSIFCPSVDEPDVVDVFIKERDSHCTQSIVDVTNDYIAIYV